MYVILPESVNTDRLYIIWVCECTCMYVYMYVCTYVHMYLLPECGIYTQVTDTSDSMVIAVYMVNQGFTTVIYIGLSTSFKI